MFDKKTASQVAAAPMALALRWAASLDDAAVEELHSILSADDDLDSALGEWAIERVGEIQAARAAPPPPPPAPAKEEDDAWVAPPTFKSSGEARWRCPRDVKRINLGKNHQVWMYEAADGSQAAVVRKNGQYRGRKNSVFAHIRFLGLPPRRTRERATAIWEYMEHWGGYRVTSATDARSSVKYALAQRREDRFPESDIPASHWSGFINP